MSTSEGTISSSIEEYLKNQQPNHQQTQFHITSQTTPKMPKMTEIYDSSHIQPFGSYEKSYYTNLTNRNFPIDTLAEKSPPNTILITNNFSQQAQIKPNHLLHNHHTIPVSISAHQISDGTVSGTVSEFNDVFCNSSIKIVSTRGIHYPSNANSSSATATEVHFSSNCNAIGNAGMGRDMNLQQPPLQIYQQPQLHLPQIQIPSQMQQQHQPSLLSLAHHLNPQQYGMSSSGTPILLQDHHNIELLKEGNDITPSSPKTSAKTSTVVLDRINICINNHYSDTVASVSSPVASTTSQTSPIIPAIQHKSIVKIGNEIAIESLPFLNIKKEVVDEPDSTTTPKSPSTSPDTPPYAQFPSVIEKKLQPIMKREFLFPVKTTTSKVSPNNKTISNVDQSENLTTDEKNLYQEKINNLTLCKVEPITFAIGEDALLKRRDGRYYLGKIIDFHCQQYLVQFDDKRSSGHWSSVDNLRKLNTVIMDKAMCVGCKQVCNSSIEICQRCGRGYHQDCTEKLDDDWLCKRCNLPMKMGEISKAKFLDKDIFTQINTSKKPILQMPYELNSLNWDRKHRVNLEQIYCYCGKFGQFDYNMLQCCKCKQWFHFNCMQSLKTPVMRGDCFFVFACSVCNKGCEFIRRLELKWVDLVHVIMFNLTLINRQKYHHLEKDIWPFALKKRSTMHISQEMCNMTKTKFEKLFLQTLKDNLKRFQCGSEIKKDHFNWGLRKNGPPIMPDINVNRNEHLSNSFIANTLGLILLEGAQENVLDDPEEIKKDGSDIDLLKIIDTEKENKVDEKFESDDEIPIKAFFIDKAKMINNSRKTIKSDTIELENTSAKGKSKLSSSTLNKNSSTKNTPEQRQQNVKQARTNLGKIINHSEKNNNQSEIIKCKKSMQQNSKNSRKRKTFTLSKSYNDSSTANKTSDAPSGSINKICDSSSDENSSSSRGTLDLIIPPPENFLGVNNPFRIISPKKGEPLSQYINMTASVVARKSVGFNKSINKNSNGKNFTTGLDFSSKLAALKSSGLFPNLSNSDLAKAAGQPRLVRTFKRRLSVRDITIGPNQEIRRRRTKRLSSSIELISETTINPIKNNFLPIYAKDISSSTLSSSIATTMLNSKLSSVSSSNLTRSSSNTSPPSILSSICASTNVVTQFNGRRLRQRRSDKSPNDSRRNSLTTSSAPSSIDNLKQSVNIYFGAVNRIEQGEQFCIKAKRKLSDGQTQYLIEWSDSFLST